jgi:hypothetical protein
MIWLYLLVLTLSITGLVVVFAEWRRGVRQGLVGPLATFMVATLVTGLALTWLIALGDEGESSVRWTDASPDVAAEPVEGVASGRVAARRVQDHEWWSWFATAVAGLWAYCRERVHSNSFFCFGKSQPSGAVSHHRPPAGHPEDLVRLNRRPPW